MIGTERGSAAVTGVAMLVAGFLSGLAVQAAAQEQPRPERLEITVTPWGEVLDFHPDGGWRVRARQVAQRRAQLRASGDVAALNAGAASSAITGTVFVPAIFFRFQDKGFGASRDTSEYSTILFGTIPPGARPYTVRTFYEQMSNGLVSVQGEVLGWYTLSGNESSYTGQAGTCTGNPFGTANCNGIFSSAAFSGLNTGLRAAITMADPAVDFGQFDNDGPDGVPNSGDDDGIVDMLLFVHSEHSGACGGATNNHIWAHKSSALAGVMSGDARFGGGMIMFRDYTIQSAVGGSGGCDSTQAMPIGTTSHETGHAFGLPDLYDTSQLSEGIGRWGLMGSGNWSTQTSPARMMPWSLNQLGWVTIVPVSSTGTYTLGAAATADSALMIDVQGADPRDEYFLIENRQGVESDTAMVRRACDVDGLTYPVNCAGGLAIWHIDGTRLSSGGGVNTGSIHGVGLVQADGLNQLRTAGGNRGDGGDPYPGTTGNTEFSISSSPAAFSNAGAYVGFVIDSIRQVVPGGEMAFRIRFGGPTVVQAEDPAATVWVDGASYSVFNEVLEDGSTHTIAIDSAQLSPDGRTEWLFQTWSDGGARTHDITAQLAGDTIVADVLRRFRVLAAVTGQGSVTSDSVPDPSGGGFVSEGSLVRLVAVPGTGQWFEGWSGDTASGNDTLAFSASRPFDLVATFASQLTASQASPPPGVIGAGYVHGFGASGGIGGYGWTLTAGQIPPGLVLSISGALVGTPDSAGTFAFTVAVTSGSQVAEVSSSIAVTAPQLATTTVLQHLIGTGTGLSGDERNYLDLIGNRNGQFDLGDFLAWVQATGATVSADEMARAARAGGGGGGTR